MGILAECPECHRKQVVKRRVCKCGKDLTEAKRSKKVNYWIRYWLNSKERREPVGTSITKARDALSKRRVQRREKRFFDILALDMTFNEIAKWYFDRQIIKNKPSCRNMRIRADNFNNEFGHKPVGDLRKSDLEDYQLRRQAMGKADATIDDEIGQARMMVKAAVDNDKLSADALKPFDVRSRLLKRHANRRTWEGTQEDVDKLIANAADHIKEIITLVNWTGMRHSEATQLEWGEVDLKAYMIRLPDTRTKEGEAKDIPMAAPVYEILKAKSGPHSADQNYVFLYHGQPIKDIGKAVETACQKAEIRHGRDVKNGFTLHSLRGVFVSDMDRAGVSAIVRKRITGHSIKDMDERYRNVTDQDKLEAIEKLYAHRNRDQKRIDKRLKTAKSEWR